MDANSGDANSGDGCKERRWMQRAEMDANSGDANSVDECKQQRWMQMESKRIFQKCEENSFSHLTSTSFQAELAKIDTLLNTGVLLVFVAISVGLRCGTSFIFILFVDVQFLRESIEQASLEFMKAQ